MAANTTPLAGFENSHILAIGKAGGNRIFFKSNNLEILLLTHVKDGL